MASIVFLGAGVMGSALAMPPASIASNQVTLVGSPLDDDIVKAIQSDGHHPTLKADIPASIRTLALNELDVSTLRSADIIVIGVSSAGIDWVTDYLNTRQIKPAALALVTKGLVVNPEKTAAPLTYADTLPGSVGIAADRVVGIGGPCIARELALGFPTRVSFASTDLALANSLRDCFQTPYYRITTHTDIVSLEACAALKNFLCIGVSTMLAAYPLDGNHAKNPLAALYNQAVHELFILSQWIDSASPSHSHRMGGNTLPVAFDLAGMGDLHVTVGGGRNSRLGRYLGKGDTLAHILGTTMAGVTVEGVDTGRTLSAGFEAACERRDLNRDALPLTSGILDCITQDAPFVFEFDALPG